MDVKWLVRGPPAQPHFLGPVSWWVLDDGRVMPDLPSPMSPGRPPPTQVSSCPSPFHSWYGLDLSFLTNKQATTQHPPPRFIHVFMSLTNIYSVAVLFQCYLVVLGIQQDSPENLGQHRADSLYTLATQSLVQGPAASASPGSRTETGTFSPIPALLNQNLYFNKVHEVHSHTH